MTPRQKTRALLGPRYTQALDKARAELAWGRPRASVVDEVARLLGPEAAEYVVAEALDERAGDARLRRRGLRDAVVGAALALGLTLALPHFWVFALPVVPWALSGLAMVALLVATWWAYRGTAQAILGGAARLATIDWELAPERAVFG